MRLVPLLVLAAVLAPVPTFAQPTLCDPSKERCDRLVPTVDIQARVQADPNNNSTINQNADVNMQGTVQGGNNNRSNVRQNGRINSSSTSQSQRQ